MASTPDAECPVEFYHTAGKIIFHGGQVFLKVRGGFYQLFADIRLRIWEVATT